MMGTRRWLRAWVAGAFLLLAPLAAWAGWEPLGAGVQGMVTHLACSPKGVLYVGGIFFDAGGQSAFGLASWDPASGWTPLKPTLDNTLQGMALRDDGSLVVAGAFWKAGDQDLRLVGRYDPEARTWTPMGAQNTPMNGTYRADAPGVVSGPPSALGEGASGLFAAFGTMGGEDENEVFEIRRWTGSGWSVPLGRAENVWVAALLPEPEGTLWVGGAFRRVGGTAAARVARYDLASKRWHPLGRGLGGGDVYALARDRRGHLVAGGSFTRAGGLPASRVARWDGKAWHPLGKGFNGPVQALALGPDGALYAGGDFTKAEGRIAPHLARWDGAKWEPFGPGTDGSVVALAWAPDGILYVGGDFSRVGKVPAAKVARFVP